MANHKIKSDFLADAAILLHILRSCDVSELKTLVAMFDNRPLELYRNVSLLYGAWEIERGQMVFHVLEHQARTEPSMNPLLARFGFLPSMKEVKSRKRFFDEVESLCPKLRSVKLKAVRETSDEGHGSVAISCKNSVRDLHLVLALPLGTNSDLTVFNDTAKDLFMLLFFKLSTSNAIQVVGGPHDLSKSLRYVDVMQLSKGGWITRCKCPNLKPIVCRSTHMGTGLRPREDDGVLEMGASDGQYRAGTTRFDGPIPRGYAPRLLVVEKLCVPDSCLVVLQG